MRGTPSPRGAWSGGPLQAQLKAVAEAADELMRRQGVGRWSELVSSAEFARRSARRRRLDGGRSR
ncbi:hypothetical protein [Rhodococcoides corynebacterioides]|uniref:hypothetical protein n=1 Tax=Rhodococcoides corynebacterioides TaxID=53972 RepID=UPI000836578A|nr:hypothetical protein [Rhodococcus corynebacterioides]